MLSEVELSITHRCTLACTGCGFLVPNQPAPAAGDSVEAHRRSLDRLRDADIRIRSLAIMGGEVGLVPKELERMVDAARLSGVVDRIEVVSNGLSPRGISDGALRSIDRLTISVYGYSEAFLDAWRRRVASLAPRLELVLRTHDGRWDDWSEVAPVDALTAERAFATCWYRRHCITLEREHLFVCSRIPKLRRDEEGLPLVPGVTREAIAAYLGRQDAPKSCTTCGPMLSSRTVAAGVQPDQRIERLERAAIAWLAVEANGGERPAADIDGAS